MTEIELDIRHDAKSPMLASDGAIRRHLHRLNETLAKAKRGGMSVDQLTDDEIVTIEVNVIVGRLVGAFPGTDEPLMKACDEYTALLRQKGVPEGLTPRRDPDRPLKFLQ